MNEEKTLPLSIIILTRNSAEILETALASAKFAKELLIIDQASTDQTIKIAHDFGARVLTVTTENFSEKRNAGLKEARFNWIFYLDHDEIITLKLKEELERIILDGKPAAYFVNRTNFFLGREMYPDRMERLFHKDILNRWEGQVHEHPILTQSALILENPIIHQTHTDITSMLEKTNQWSEAEADLRIQAEHPPVKWWRLIRIALTVWWDQLIHKKVWKYGREGWFEAYFQMVDKLIVYTKLWERQQQS